MSSQQRQESVLDSARTVTTYLLREPVKEAVKEALHDDRVTIRREQGAEDSGFSVLLATLAGAMLGVVAYYLLQNSERNLPIQTDVTEELTGSHDESVESSAESSDASDRVSGATGGAMGEAGSSRSGHSGEP